MSRYSNCIENLAQREMTTLDDQQNLKNLSSFISVEGKKQPTPRPLSWLLVLPVIEVKVGKKSAYQPSASSGQSLTQFL